MGRKKLLFVTSALGGGGAERVLSILVNYFYSNYDVKVVSLISARHEYPIPEDVENIFIGSAKNKIKRTLDRYYKLKKIINNYNPDLIISFGYAMNIYSLLAKEKHTILISERSNPISTPSSGLLRKIRNYLYPRTNKIVFQTKEAQSYFNNIPVHKSRIIMNPINSDLPIHKENKENKYIFSAGRLNKVKNFDLLISAFAEFRKINEDYAKYKLCIAGEGEEKEHLISLINELGLVDEVKLLGYRTDVYDLMSKASVFVLPSNYEGLSNVMLEAMAIGTPTVCTDCPIYGARMIIKNNENGILIQPNDQKALVSALDRIVSDNDFAKKISMNGQKIRTQNSIENICVEWEKIVKECLDEN